AVILDFLLDESTAGANTARHTQARDMAVQTLRALAGGALHDPLGGGFHRYSVDAAWRVPHFEKMLYDQALITNALLTAWQITADPQLRDAATDTLAYVQRDLTDIDGGFYSAEDADSFPPATLEAGDRIKQEGAFYVWTAAEIETVLGPKDAPLFGYAFGVRPEGNVAREHGAELVGKNVLYRAHTAVECAQKFGLDEATVHTALAASAAKLSAVRAQRPRPARDDKVLTAWNGLMISAYARAAQVLGEPAYATTAERAAAFLREKLRDPTTGRLAHSYRASIRDDHGFAEDYAFLVQGLLDLYEATFDVRHLDWAVELQERQNELFWDDAAGGYFASAGGDPGVLLRLKVASDGAEPSPNSVAVRNLARLAAMLHRDEWRELALRTARAFGPKLEQSPFDLPQMIAALGWLDRPPQQILIQGEPDDPHTARLVAEVWRRHLPRHVLLRIDRASRPALEQKVEFIRALPAEADAPPTAYVCENFACQLPTGDPAVLAQQLTPALRK
ncbi:MAG TPA: thioredoxin domain-containing protein, partial [Lacunisphaera sp.]